MWNGILQCGGRERRVRPITGTHITSTLEQCLNIMIKITYYINTEHRNSEFKWGSDALPNKGLVSSIPRLSPLGFQSY